MKPKLTIRLKVVFLTLIAIVILLTSYLLYREILIPTHQLQINQVYRYKNNVSAYYIVNLKPNNLYKGKTLESGKLYITELIDFINTKFDYEFSGEGNVDIGGEYNTFAKVQGFVEEGKSQIIIWEKDFPIVRHRNFSSNDGKVSINEEVKLYLSEYNAFAKEIIETTKINCDTQLTLLMDINLTGTTDKGTFEEHITPNIVIPLNTPLFEITTNNVEKPGAIEETIQVPVPVEKGKVIFYGVIIGICALGLIFLIFFTKVAPKKDPLEKEINKIFKKHGDRLVALNSDVDLTDAKYVRTIDDLVRFADEVERPILYKYSDDYKDINIFYVANGDEMYVFDIEESLPKQETISEQVTVNSEQQG